MSVGWSQACILERQHKTIQPWLGLFLLPGLGVQWLMPLVVPTARGNLSLGFKPWQKMQMGTTIKIRGQNRPGLLMVLACLAIGVEKFLVLPLQSPEHHLCPFYPSQDLPLLGVNGLQAWNPTHAKLFTAHPAFRGLSMNLEGQAELRGSLGSLP